MSKIKLITCSDDRSGRKGGQYSATQDRIAELLDGWIDQHHYRLPEFIDCDPLMVHTDAAKNGRVYKPWCILQSLVAINEGDYLIYNDCSPELWEGVSPLTGYSLEVIKGLCDHSGGLLVGFVKWDTEFIGPGQLGKHTHRWFTPENLLQQLDADEYYNSFLCASGMICIKKTLLTETIITQWLLLNRQAQYSCMNVDETENNYHSGKAGDHSGHRHDQGILSILLNLNDWNYCDIVYNSLNPYNFLNFCLPRHEYTFINSNSGIISSVCKIS